MSTFLRGANKVYEGAPTVLAKHVSSMTYIRWAQALMTCTSLVEHFGLLGRPWPVRSGHVLRRPQTQPASVRPMVSCDK